jgi:MinD-like ATPase involved in chromosome partitioning or flagellar assembly
MTARPLQSLREFMQSAPVAPRAVVHHPNVLVVGAGKGGVGTSTAALLLARSAARRGVEVLLVEADDGVASIPLLAGIGHEVEGVGMLHGGRRSPEALLLPLEAGLTLLPGGGADHEGHAAPGPGERRALFRRVTGLYERYPLVVVDAGARLESVASAAAQGAATLLVVSTADRIALAGAYALLKVAHHRLGGLPVELLVNAATDDEGRYAHALAARAAEDFLAAALPLAGSLPRDPAVEQAVASGVGILGLPWSRRPSASRPGSWSASSVPDRAGGRRPAS